MDNSSCWHFTLSEIYTFYDYFFFIPLSQSQVAKRNGRFMFSAFHICMHGYHMDRTKKICQVIHCQLYRGLKHLPIAHAFRLDTNLISFFPPSFPHWFESFTSAFTVHVSFVNWSREKNWKSRDLPLSKTAQCIISVQIGLRKA